MRRSLRKVSPRKNFITRKQYHVFLYTKFLTSAEYYCECSLSLLWYIVWKIRWLFLIDTMYIEKVICLDETKFHEPFLTSLAVKCHFNIIMYVMHSCDGKSSVWVNEMGVVFIQVCSFGYCHLYHHNSNYKYIFISLCMCIQMQLQHQSYFYCLDMYTVTKF